MPGRFRIDETNNFLGIRLVEKETGKTVIAKHANARGISGILFDRVGTEGAEVFVGRDKLETYDFQGEHFYRGFSFRTESSLRFIVNWYSSYASIVRWYDKLYQIGYNKRTLARRDRFELLIYLVERTVDDFKYSISHIGLMEELFSLRWFRHPKREQTENYYQLILNSLVETEDLKIVDQNRYALGKRALATISQERLAREGLGTQKAMWVLTAGLILVGIGQLVAAFLGR